MTEFEREVLNLLEQIGADVEKMLKAIQSIVSTDCVANHTAIRPLGDYYHFANWQFVK